MFDHYHVAGHQVGRRHPRQLVIREVPRLDPQDHSQWGADHHGVIIGAGGVKPLGGQESLGVLGVVVEDLRAELHLTQTLGIELAHFQREQPSELVQAFAKDRRGAPAHRRALAKRRLAPRLKRLLRLREKLHGLLVGQVIKGGHYLVVERVDGLVSHRVSSLRFAAAPRRRRC